MPQAEQRQRFLANITRETQRIQEMVDRMMELTALETRRALEHVEPVALRAAAGGAGGQPRRPPRRARAVRVQLDAARRRRGRGRPLPAAPRRRATCWTTPSTSRPTAAQVQLRCSAGRARARIAVRDQGPGIPEYAQDKVFEKFYSLARPHSQQEEHRPGPGLRARDRVAAPRPHRAGQRARRRRAGTLSLPPGRPLKPRGFTRTSHKLPAPSHCASPTAPILRPVHRRTTLENACTPNPASATRLSRWLLDRLGQHRRRRLLACSPARAQDGRAAAEDREPVLLRRERRSRASTGCRSRPPRSTCASPA